LVLSVVAYFFTKKLFVVLKKAKDNDNDELISFVSAIAIFIGAVLCSLLVVAVLCSIDGVAQIINPEYYAIKELLPK